MSSSPCPVQSSRVVPQQQNSTYSLAGMSPTRIFAAEQTLLMEASKKGSNFEPWSPPSHPEGPMKAEKSSTGLLRSDSKPSPTKKGTAACVALAEIGIVPTRKRRPGTGPVFSEGTTTSPFANVQKVQRYLSSASVDQKTPLSPAFPNRDGDSASLQERKGRRGPTLSELKFSGVDDKRIPNIAFLTPRYYLSLHFSLPLDFTSTKLKSHHNPQSFWHSQTSASRASPIKILQFNGSKESNPPNPLLIRQRSAAHAFRGMVSPFQYRGRLVAALMNYSVRVLRVEARVSVRVVQVATQIINYAAVPFRCTPKRHIIMLQCLSAARRSGTRSLCNHSVTHSTSQLLDPDCPQQPHLAESQWQQQAAAAAARASLGGCRRRCHGLTS